MGKGLSILCSGLKPGSSVVKGVTENMRLSRHLGRTLREVSKDTQMISHKLLVKGGYVRQLSAGVFVHMPFFLKVIDKIEQIVRRELATAQFEEISMPSLQPEHVYAESSEDTSLDGKWDETFHFKDLRGSRFYLGLPYEDMVASLVEREVSSYKQLPKRVFDIGKRFRDHRRPRFGLLGAREFVSCDAFSFDENEEKAAYSYGVAMETCKVILSKVGAQYRCVESHEEGLNYRMCHEFLMMAEAGEEVLLRCNNCQYAASQEKAESRLATYQDPNEAPRPMEEVRGEGLIGVEPLAEFLGLPVWKTTKTLLFQADERVVAVMVRGDCEVNEAKVKRFLGCTNLSLASARVVKETTGAEVGYAGPIGLPQDVLVLADEYTRNRINFECGANKTDHHMINVNFERDFPLPTFGDFKLARAGHFCPRCDEGVLMEERGVSVGRLVMFEGGQGSGNTTRWTYVDRDGKSRQFVIGSYSLGISRIAAALVEQNHDDLGIIWPSEIAPFHAYLVGLNLEDEEVRNKAEALYQELQRRGVDVLYDDREVRAGEKFDDADLLGIPVRLTISKRTIREGKIEFKLRKGDEKELTTYEDVLGRLKSLYADINRG